MDATSPLPDDAPVCPRHPDRVSRLACRGCGRPTCPVCQVPGADGFLCVDCDAQRRAASASPRLSPGLSSHPGPGRGASGATWSSASPVDETGATAARQHPSDPAGFSSPGDPVRPVVATKDRPVATWSLVAVCVVVYVFQLLFPAVTEVGDFYPLAASVQPWRFLTAAFLHSPENPAHIIFNLMGLYAMGQFLEPALGRARYIALYLLSALGGSVGYLVMLPTLDLTDRATQSAWAGSMVGASGAVFGLFTAALIVLRRSGSQIRGMIVLIAINLAMPLFYPGIAWQAHLGGAVVGFVVTLLMVLAAPRGPVACWAAVLVPLVVLVLAAWFAFHASAPALSMLQPYIELQG